MIVLRISWVRYKCCGMIESMSQKSYTNKTGDWHEYIICNQWYFLGINFRFQQILCDGCHDMSQTSISFNDVAIVTVERNDYTIHFLGANKSEIMNRMKNIDLKMY